MDEAARVKSTFQFTYLCKLSTIVKAKCEIRQFFDVYLIDYPPQSAHQLIFDLDQPKEQQAKVETKWSFWLWH